MQCFEDYCMSFRRFWIFAMVESAFLRLMSFDFPFFQLFFFKILDKRFRSDIYVLALTDLRQRNIYISSL